ncbi:MAG: biopolymer transporter ExbD [Bacteroidales bacterium]|nr:biopolymer transporter ExbD [Bacteroidales bacterium]
MARKVSELNASSVADIAFLLLIFFLVATTMDVDSGLSRKLSPMPEPGAENNQMTKERNVFVVLINQYDRILVDGVEMDVHNLRKEAKEFIANPHNKANLPEKTLKHIDYLGDVMVSKGIISLMNDRATSYGIYLKVQNELVAAYNEVREEAALRRFGKHYNELIKEKQDAIKKLHPQIISEAEPKNIGGKK